MSGDLTVRPLLPLPSISLPAAVFVKTFTKLLLRNGCERARVRKEFSFSLQIIQQKPTFIITTLMY